MLRHVAGNLSIRVTMNTSHATTGKAGLRWLRLAAILCITASFSPVAMAQNTTTNTTDTAVAAPGSMGWAPFTLADKRALNLSDDQMLRLHEMDNRFSEAYNGMGIEPWQNKEFPALNRQRNHAIEEILDDRQYEQWATPSTPVPTVAPTILPDRSGGSGK